MTDAIVEKDKPETRFTLRKLFGLVWVVAALLGAGYRLDQYSPLLLAFLGLPAAALATLVISGQKHDRSLRYALMLWVSLAMVFGVVLPIMFNRLNCPFELPPSATRLQASDRMNGFTGADTRVTFHASVEDCYATLAKVERVYHVKFEPGLPIDHPLPNSRFTFVPAWGNSPRHQLTWFNPNKIEEGEYFSNGCVQVWIDTQRGIFYMDAFF